MSLQLYGRSFKKENLLFYGSYVKVSRTKGMATQTAQNEIKFSPVNIEARRAIDIRPGDTVRVYSKIEEKGKTRLQMFEGIVLARKHGTEPGATITVRREGSEGVGGIGVERIFPLYSPNVDKIEVIKRAKVRRAKLYYIREKVAREIRKKMRAMRLTDAQQITYQEKEEELY